MKCISQGGEDVLKEARESKKITQQKLAEKLNVSRYYISRLECRPHTCNPTIKIILGLSTELEIEHEELYNHFVKSINAALLNENDTKKAK
jgi:transcriptional regulator with XRE-family HTH domain